MKKIILILLVVMGSCSSDEPNSQVYLEAGTGFYVVDEQGEDLLNPNHPTAINFNKVRIYHLINGEEVEQYDANLDSPRRISLHEPNDKHDKYYLSLGFNIKQGGDTTYTIVQWDEGDRDVFKVEFSRGEDYTVAVKCWVNEELVWEAKKQERFFTLVK